LGVNMDPGGTGRRYFSSDYLGHHETRKDGG